MFFRMLALSTLSIVLVGQGVDAAHHTLEGEFRVVRAGVVQAEYLAGVLCDATLCQVDVDTDFEGKSVTKRDAGFFERWCGGNPITVVIPAGESGASFTCQGNGHWWIEGSVVVYSLAHESSIDVLFAVTPYKNEP